MGLRPLLLVLLVATFAAAPLHAQYLAQPAVSEDCGSAQSCSASLSAGVTAGNALIAVVRIGEVQTVSGTTITDSLANTWVLDGYQLQSSDVHVLAIYRAAATKAGALKFTVANHAAQTMRIISLAEVSGMANASPEAASSAQGSGTNAQPGPLATHQAGDYVLVATSTANNQSFAATSPLQMVSQVTKGAVAGETDPQFGTLSPAMTFGVQDQWAAVALAYKSSGPPKLPINLTLHYSDGSSVAGTVVLSSLANNSKTTIKTWPISGSGQAAIYVPIVNSGTYEYDFYDSNSNLMQSYVILPGAFYSLLTPAHSLTSSITLNKSNHSIVIPVSFSFQ